MTDCPLERLRIRLVGLRAEGLAFEEAWPWAARRLPGDRDTAPALDDTRWPWEDAYERRGERGRRGGLAG